MPWYDAFADAFASAANDVHEDADVAAENGCNGGAFCALRGAAVRYVGGGREAERIVDALTLFAALLLAMRLLDRIVDASVAVASLCARLVRALVTSTLQHVHNTCRSLCIIVALAATCALAVGAVSLSGLVAPHQQWLWLAETAQSLTVDQLRALLRVPVNAFLNVTDRLFE